MQAEKVSPIFEPAMKSLWKFNGNFGVKVILRNLQKRCFDFGTRKLWENKTITITTLRAYSCICTFCMGVPGWGKIKTSLIRFCFPAACLPLVNNVIIGIGSEKLPSLCNRKTRCKKELFKITVGSVTSVSKDKKSDVNKVCVDNGKRKEPYDINLTNVFASIIHARETSVA